MDAYEPFISIGIALGAGLLIGIEREQSQAPDTETFLGGARTFPLFALLGALSVILAQSLTVAFPIVAFAGVVVLVALSYADDLKKGHGRGMTTEVAALVTFAIGQLAGSAELLAPWSHRVLVVAALAVLVTFLLSSKPRLQSVMERVTKDDFYSTVKFLILAVLVLPLLPDTPMGPLDVVRPFQVGVMVVLIASIGFVGYVASRILGQGRGLVVTAIAGGLVSSTAVTLSFAGRAKKDPSMVPGAALAIVLASTIMLGRVLVEVAVVHLPLVGALAIPLGAMAVAGLVTGGVLYRRTPPAAPSSSALPLSNPFELSTAIRFGLIYVAIVVISKAAQTYAGAAGMYVAAAVAGATDVDAITLSTAGMARDGLDAGVATTTILIGVVSNTIVKTVMAATLGGWALGRRALLMAGTMLVGAALGVAVVWLR